MMFVVMKKMTERAKYFVCFSSPLDPSDKIIYL